MHPFDGTRSSHFFETLRDPASILSGTCGSPQQQSLVTAWPYSYRGFVLTTDCCLTDY
ncbi:MAG: hypothetical protein WAM44_07090 [Chthoniobacterales bacterium]